MSAHPHRSRRSAAPTNPVLRLAEVLEAAKGHLADESYAPYTRSVLLRLARCKSGDFGYMELGCSDCDHSEWRPRGCGARHCPSCGYQRVDDWVDARKEELLDCPYFQLVFTLPPLFYPLLKDNPEKLYGILCDAVRDTLIDVAANPTHLGGKPQFFLALHTWNSALDFHVHIHVLIAAGAYDLATDTWIPARHPDFLFPLKVLSALFRGKFLDKLNRLQRAGLLNYTRLECQSLQAPGAWQDFLTKAYDTDFFTFEERSAVSPVNLLQYLGHYLQRTGISNHRLLALHDGNVSFRCKDRKKRFSETGSYVRTLPLNDFVDTYAQHILPKGFRRVRMCGLWSPPNKQLLPKVRAAIARANTTAPLEPDDTGRSPSPPLEAAASTEPATEPCTAHASTPDPAPPAPAPPTYAAPWPAPAPTPGADASTSSAAQTSSPVHATPPPAPEAPQRPEPPSTPCPACHRGVLQLRLTAVRNKAGWRYIDHSRARGPPVHPFSATADPE